MESGLNIRLSDRESLEVNESFDDQLGFIDICDSQCVANLEKLVAELTKKPEEETDEDVEETPDPETEPEDEDTPKITKSEKVIIETETVQQKNYYQMSGRDPLTGKKIRK